MKIVGLLLLVLVIVAGVRLYQLSRQTERYKNYWQTRAVAPVPDNALLYVALGDSTAQGIGASKPENGYVGLLVGRLAEKTARKVKVINLSVSGARIQQVVDQQLPRFRALHLPADAVVTVDIGSNNMRDFEPDTFKAQFENLLQQLPKQTIVGNIPYFGPDYHGHGGRQASQANVIVDELVREYGFAKAEVYGVTEGHNGLSYYAADLFHPSDKSYKNWADAFWHILDKEQL